MVEIVEYTLVVLCSSIFAVASFAVFSAYGGYGNGLESRATFASLTNLAAESVLNGNSSAPLAFPRSTVSCEAGTMVLNSSSGTESERIGVACNFSFEVEAGVHLVSFSSSRSGLSMSVS